jgi:hypothetical protein
LGSGVTTFSTIGCPPGVRQRYRIKVSLKRSAQCSNFTGEIEAASGRVSPALPSLPDSIR